MNKRVIAAIAAAVLALLGVLVLVTWAQRANDRAFEGADLVRVVRLTADTAAGASTEDLAGSTETVKLPKVAVPPGAVTSLDQVKGLTTNASLQRGEVLLTSRMAAAGEKPTSDGGVPAGYQQVTIALPAERSVGGQIEAGDTVGVIISTEGGTNVVINQVPVTKVASALGGDEGTVADALITVAVKPLDAERIVHGQRWATVWLTLQNADTDTAGSKLVTTEDVLR